tara:strand:- start:4744 stop:7593 length:2850 start_codon:yes stop_codon:yes gene_type:complete
MCQLKVKSAGQDITRDLITEQTDQVLSICPMSTNERKKLIKELEERFTVWTDPARVLSNDDKHVGWLPQKKGTTNWRFWDRYESHLSAKLPPAAVDSVERVTDQILSNLEDPAREGPWDRRGLVMGHVQSGKTANYTGLICKAADAGYKVIIVLAGMHNNLRSQTQIRLDEGFLGYKATPNKDGNSAKELTGVGNIDPSPIADSVTNRNNNGDFRSQIAQQFGIHPGGHPLLFVVKKNASVLRNLLSWIRGSADMTDPETGRKFHTEVPLLVIDDEADQASVDTKEISRDEDGDLDPDHNPARINSLVRQLLYSFAKSAYVGYTATPFANIYIFEKGKTNDEGVDLFPGSFIINIPAPSNYLGASRVFGIAGDADSGLGHVNPLPIKRTIDDYAHKRDKNGDVDDEKGIIDDRETEGWMPPRLLNRTVHIPMYEGKRIIPPSLYCAVLSFILSTTVRKLREGSGLHNSMLIHVVRFTLVQQEVATQVESALNQIKSRIQNGDGARMPTIVDELRALWETDYVETSQSAVFKEEPFHGDLELPAWDEVESELWNVVSSIVVRTINGSAADALDYEEHSENGLNVIAIGGDKLSRGLTLEGLTISYFLRASKMYDTLMQMGRWFGYRSNYADVCRLFTSEGLVEWFAHIAVATEELRSEFDYMVNVGGTPRDYGLKVRSHPLLLVTSNVKMRSGVNLDISYAGSISETITYHADAMMIQRNYLAVKTWLLELGSSEDGSGVKGGYFWKGIEASKLLELLNNFQTHHEAHRAKTELLTAYIKMQLKQDELTDWDVILVSNNKAASRPHVMDGIGKVGLIQRSQFPESRGNEKKYSIRRLLSPTDEAKDLSWDGESPEYKRALEITKSNWKQDQRKNKPRNEPKRPGGREIRSVRHKSKGFLILYPLDSHHAKLDTNDPVMGLAISFPQSDTAKAITYTVTQTYYNADEFDFS